MSVSIVMATYNRENYLPAAIESVLAQTHQDLELVVVDDGSTDSTPELLERYARSDSRVRALRQKNSGVSAARNLAIAHSRFPLVAIADDDDISCANRLAVQYEYLNQHPEKCAVFSYGYLIDDKSHIIGTSISKPDFARATRLRRADLALELIHGTAIFRKDAISAVGGYRLPKLEDRDLLGRLWTAGYDFGVLPMFLYQIRRHGKNNSRDFARNTLLYGDFVDFNVMRRFDCLPELSYEDYCERLKTAPLLERLRGARNIYARFAYDRATLSYSQRHLASALAFGLTALSLRPATVGRKIAQKLIWRT